MKVIAILCASVLSIALGTQAPIPIIMPASVQTLQVGGNWTRFQFAGDHSNAEPGFFLYLQDGDEAILQVTDYYCTGERFAVIDNGKELGSTSKSVYDQCQTTTADINVAFASPKWSSGQYNLKSGGHQITIKVLDNPNQSGAGALRVISKTHHCGCHN